MINQDVKHPRVLVIDDDRAVLDAVGRTLSNAGFDATRVTSVNEAKRQITDSNYDCVVTDWKMPVGGRTLLEWMDQHFPSIPRIVHTGTQNPTDLTTIRSMKIAALLRKPVRGEEIVRALSECLPGNPKA